MYLIYALPQPELLCEWVLLSVHCKSNQQRITAMIRQDDPSHLEDATERPPCLMSHELMTMG